MLEVQKAKRRLQDLQGQLDQLSKEENRQRQLAAAARCRKQALAALERLRDVAVERELLLQAITQAHGTVQKAQAVAAQAAAKAAATGKQLSPNAPWCELPADGVGELLADHVSGLLRALHAGLFPHQAPPGGAVGRRTFELMLGQIIPALQPALPAPQLGVPDDLLYLEVTAAALLGIREQAARVLELCEEVYRGKDLDGGWDDGAQYDGQGALRQFPQCTAANVPPLVGMHEVLTAPPMAFPCVLSQLQPANARS